MAKKKPKTARAKSAAQQPEPQVIKKSPQPKQKTAKVKSVADSSAIDNKDTVKVETTENDNSRNIIIAAVIVILIFAGVGFLVLGLWQSLLSSNDEMNRRIAQLQEDTTDEEPRPGQITDEAASTDEPSDSDETENEPDSSDDSGEGDDDDNNNTDNEAGDEDNDDDNDTEGEQSPPVVPSTPTVPSQTRYAATSNSYRRGNTYMPGSIQGSSYTVKQGDTLWQIAQGRYGSGYAWVEINKANGGFGLLRNGVPVNIPVGYTLLLPQI